MTNETAITPQASGSMTAARLRTFRVVLGLAWAFVAGAAGPLVLAKLADSETRSALSTIKKQDDALRNLGAACDRRDAAYRSKAEAQGALVAELQRGLNARDQLLDAHGWR